MVGEESRASWVLANVPRICGCCCGCCCVWVCFDYACPSSRTCAPAFLQMPDNFMCIGPQGILAAQQQPFITISPVTEISTFPVRLVDPGLLVVATCHLLAG